MELTARFTEKASAKNLERKLCEALGRVNLELANISGITTDGASVMKTLGCSLKEKAVDRPFYHQLCLAHSLHLAVMDTFKPTASAIREQEVSPEGCDSQERVEWSFAAAADPDIEADLGKITHSMMR